MSFLMAYLFEDKSLLTADRMITFADGSHEISSMVKFTKLSPHFICGMTGNSSVWQLMEATLSGLCASCNTLDEFALRLKFFKDAFTPIYEGIPKEELSICKGSGQLMGIISAGDEMGIFSVNHSPSQNDYEATLCRKAGAFICSNPDGNRKIIDILRGPVFRILLKTGGRISEEKLFSTVVVIYRNLSLVDPTISAPGALILWRRGGEFIGVEFGNDPAKVG